MVLKLWHCTGARSVRPLWTMEEMGLDYQLEVMQFPPRFMHTGYTEINPIGTVPFFTDEHVAMTESAGISQYLVDRYGPTELALTVDEPDYGLYLNWLHRSDATLTFPQTLVLRYSQLEPEERRLPQVVEDYSKWFFSRLRSLEIALDEREYLCADRFTIADVSVGYALYLAESLGLRDGFKAQTNAYYERIKVRPAFIKATSL
ncbi:MAG: glutathione S-transferase family protein [Cellvibrionales bacterium]|nr:glutathione S-transferase family protein [Porticoccaceae bacterium]